MIVCGDIGMGFQKDEYYFLMFKKLNLKLSRNNNHLVMFRGNHDNPDYFNGSFKKYRYIHIIPDYTVVSVLSINVLCVGGPVSVDRHYRINMESRGGKKHIGVIWNCLMMKINLMKSTDSIRTIFR
ncbi:MAG: hypothetical protein LBR64_02325 [Dysgonamonadaceae bacterium]|nr:hypothetical protein [Dysgonamonadaceae bacterium]